MPIWFQILMTVIGWTGIVGIIVKGVIDYMRRKRVEVQRLKDKEHLDNLTTTIKNIIRDEVQPINSRLSTLETKLDGVKLDLVSTKDGIQAELKHDIRNSCRRCIEQGFKTEDDLQEITSMHDNYEKLGTNGVTNALDDEFQKLPLVPNGYKKETVKRKKSTKQSLVENK